MRRALSSFLALFLGLLFFSAPRLAAEEVLWPVYGNYTLTSVRDLSVALANDKRVNLWNRIALLEKGARSEKAKVDKVLAAEEKIDALWAKTLLGLKNKDVSRIRKSLGKFHSGMCPALGGTARGAYRGCSPSFAASVSISW